MKKAIQLIVVFGLVVAAAVKYWHNDNETFAHTSSYEHSDKALPRLVPEEIVGIKLINQFGRLTINKHTKKVLSAGQYQKQTQWLIKERENYPANARRINEALVYLADLKKTQHIEATPEQHQFFELEDPESVNSSFGNKMILITESGEEIAFISGEFQSSTSEASRIFGDTFDGRQFIRTLPNNDVYLVNNSLYFVNTVVHDWLSPKWATEHHHKKIEMYQNGQLAWVMSRQSPEALFTVYPSESAEKNNQGKILINLTQSIDYAYSSVVLMDVLPEELDENITTKVPSDYYLNFHHFDGQIHRMYIGGRTKAPEQGKQISKAKNGLFREVVAESWRYVKLDWLNRAPELAHETPFDERYYLITATLMDKMLLDYNELLVFEKLTPANQ